MIFSSLSSPLPSTGLPSSRRAAKLAVDRVADAVVAAVDPGEDFERLAGDEHLAAADDRAPRFVDDLGLIA